MVRVWLSAWGPAVIGGEALRGAPGPSGLDWAVRLALPSPPDKRRSSPMAEVGLPEAERRRDSGTNGVWGQGLPGGGWREARPAGKGRGAAQRRGGSGRGRASDWSANGTVERGLWALGAGVGRWPRIPRRAGTGHPADFARLPPAQGALRAIGGQARSPRRPPGEGPWVQSSGSSRGGTSLPWRHPHLGLDGSLLRGCPVPCSTPGLTHGTPGASPPRSLDIAKRPLGGQTALPSQATPVFRGVLRRSLERAPSHLAACSQGVQHPAHTFHCV